MNILVLIHEYPPIGGGGGPIAADLSKEWVKEGNRVRIITAAFGNLPQKEIQNGVEIIRIKSHRKESFRAKMPAMIGFLNASIRYLFFKMKDFKPDIIHVHFAVPNGPAAMIYSRFTHIPYVITIHLGDIPGASPEKTKNWFKVIYPFTPPIWKNAAKIIAVSEYSKDLALKSYSVNIDVISNGIDYEKIHNANIEIHHDTQIVFAGRFVPQKNISTIIKTLNNLKGLNWHCTLIGDGQEKDNIISLINESSMQNKFTLTGWKEPEDVMNIFKQSDILFLPSLYEGLSVVGIQAMACGLALVLSNRGGNPEIVKEGFNGFIEDPNDINSFTADIRELLQNKGKLIEFRNNSLCLAKEFDIKKSANSYLRIFNQIVNNKK